nr:hypothetical protein [Corynebacterium lactis]
MSTPQLPAEGQPAAPQPPAQIPTRTRIVQLTFLIILVGATIALAYWQFSRWNTTSSFQNLGYALQWPAFGLFFIWAYRKYMAYERERLEGNEEAAVVEDPEVMTEIPDDFLPTNPDGTRKHPRPTTD